MTSCVGRLMLAAALATTLTVTAAWAQTAEIRGVVQRVDLLNRTVYFTDDRSVTLDPGARLFVGNREVKLIDVQPGWTLLLLPATAAAPAPPDTTVAQPTAPAAPTVSSAPAAPIVTSAPTATTAPAYPPIDATGVVAQVDRQTGTITLQDGRVLRATGRTTIWQPVTIGSVAPGASVYVRNAEAVDFRPTAQPAPDARRFHMGTVGSVDATNARVLLSDGTVVHLRPGSRLDYDGRSVAITDLRPGDEIVVGMPAAPTVTVTPSTGASVNALPRATVLDGVVEGDEVHVVRRPQSL
jgi:hypothetical protein